MHPCEPIVTILGPDPQFSSSSSHATPQSPTVARDPVPVPDPQVAFDPAVPSEIRTILLDLLANADMPTDLADYADPYPDMLTDHDRYADPSNYYPDTITNPDMTRDLDPRLSYSLHPV